MVSDSLAGLGTLSDVGIPTPLRPKLLEYEFGSAFGDASGTSDDHKVGRWLVEAAIAKAKCVPALLLMHIVSTYKCALTRR